MNTYEGYEIRAWYPNSTIEPLVVRKGHYAEALDEVLRLVRTGTHTIIDCVTPDRLELFRFWGQPPAPDRAWP